MLLIEFYSNHLRPCCFYKLKTRKWFVCVFSSKNLHSGIFSNKEWKRHNLCFLINNLRSQAFKGINLNAITKGKLNVSSRLLIKVGLKNYCKYNSSAFSLHSSPYFLLIQFIAGFNIKMLGREG